MSDQKCENRVDEEIVDDQRAIEIKAFEIDSMVHQNDVKYLMNYISYILKLRSQCHDNDKLDFEGNLQEWKEYFKEGHHFEGNSGNTHHHKEDVEDVLGVIEMLCDWVAASARRTGILDPNTTRLPQLDWNNLMRNTLKIIVDIWNNR